jgi:hypothetical protein
MSGLFYSRETPTFYHHEFLLNLNKLSLSAVSLVGGRSASRAMGGLSHQ